MNSLVSLGFLFLFMIVLAFLSGKKFFDSENFFPFGGNFPDSPNSRNIRSHPVLEYQRNASYDTHPASWGDPIRPLGISSGPSASSFSASRYDPAYDYSNIGPEPGMMMNVPVPAGSLKESNEKWDYPFYYQPRPLQPYDYFKPYGPNQNNMQKGLGYADTPFYKRDFPESRSFSREPNIPYQRSDTMSNTWPGSPRPALGYTGSGAIPFISSVSAYAPFPEVSTQWEKIGLIHTLNPNDNTIMNLYRKPIAPLNDLYQYMVQNRDGFMIPLKHTNFLENGDTIPHVIGFDSLGPWKANIFVENKYVWA